MQERTLTIPEIILISGPVPRSAWHRTLLTDKFTDHERKGAGRALVVVGALIAVPIAMNVLGKSEVV